MTTTTNIADQLPGILERHRKWLRDEDGGERADLTGADLSGANLAGADLAGANLARADLPWANLSGADLTGADLSGANLAGANLARADLTEALHAFATVSFLGHGERGRTLTAIRRKEGDAPELFCGCFTGNTKALREYIEKGEAKYRKTRTLALETVLTLLDARNDE